MHRMLGLMLAWFVVAVGMAFAVPARPLYVPTASTLPPPPKAVINLNGSAWLGKYNTIARTFIFEPDGTVSYKSTTPTIFKGRGSWRLEGDNIYFDHFITKGNVIMEFRGVVKDNNTIVGESTTKAGKKDMQTMQRTTVAPK
jgi:hypothetical protein